MLLSIFLFMRICTSTKCYYYYYYSNLRIHLEGEGCCWSNHSRAVKPWRPSSIVTISIRISSSNIGTAVVPCGCPRAQLKLCDARHAPSSWAVYARQCNSARGLNRKLSCHTKSHNASSLFDMFLLSENHEKVGQGRATDTPCSKDRAIR